MTRLNDFTFVYFDLGAVAIKDFKGTDKWAEMKRFMGVPRAQDKEFDDLYDRYELRELCLTRDVDSLVPILKRKFNLKVSNDFSMLNYFVEHFEQNRSIWPIIKRVEKDHRIGFLTNMYPRMYEAIKERNLLPPFEWDVIIDSSIEGVQKPDKEIFELAERKAGVKGRKILFIDDNLKNVKAAKKHGWQTFLYNPSNHEESSRKLARALFG